jgi:hypothetical protein
MGYLHIDNLYKNKDILMFKECYALEKIHGTSAHISYNENTFNNIPFTMLNYFSGGVEQSTFERLFDDKILINLFTEKGLGEKEIVIFGEAYGGKTQKMSETYGKELKFVVFDIKVGDCWLSVSDAYGLAISLGLDFVHYNRICTDMESIDKERDAPSIQAIKNGIEEPRLREGIVLRPLIEFLDNRGNRIICKHKSDEFKETKTLRIVSEEELKILTDAKEIAEEWVTPMRLNPVLDAHKLENDPKNYGLVIKEMYADIAREGADEISMIKAAKKAISKKTIELLKIGSLNER